MNEIGKYYDDRWINDSIYNRRRSSNEDEGVEEDFSSSGSGIESNNNSTKITLRKTSSTDFEELTQMMKNSLIAPFENSLLNDNRKYSSTITTKTVC
jgi:hypothetical protein